MADTLNLDVAFRAGSAARTVAERLLTGKPQTRQELTQDLGVAVTTVNRVVEVLTGLNCTIVRDIADDGHQAVFRVTAIGDPPTNHEMLSLREEVRIVKGEMVGTATMIEFESSKARYRGQVRTLGSLPPLGRTAVVQQVAAVGEDLADVVLVEAGGKRHIEVESVQNVS